MGEKEGRGRRILESSFENGGDRVTEKGMTNLYRFGTANEVSVVNRAAATRLV